jgi:hypothetical protein
MANTDETAVAIVERNDCAVGIDPEVVTSDMVYICETLYKIVVL